MALSTLFKTSVNRILRVVNLKVDSLTVERAEQERLAQLQRTNRFSEPVFKLPASIERMDPSAILEEVQAHRDRFDDFRYTSSNNVEYTFDNPWYTSPDTEVLYAVVRRFKPNTVLEVGCGNSSRIVRQAIIDGSLNCKLVCVDPSPRREVESLADEFYRSPVEQLPPDAIIQRLGPNDVLFIDSSHLLDIGGDVAFLYSNVLPWIRSGVIIHIHDIFLPYEYPSKWVINEGLRFNEQYLVQAILNFSDAFEVLWAGYYLQRTRADFTDYFPHLEGRMAQSMWLRKI